MLRANMRSTIEKSQYKLKEVELLLNTISDLSEEILASCGHEPRYSRNDKTSYCYNCDYRRICYDARHLASYVLTEYESGDYSN